MNVDAEARLGLLRQQLSVAKEIYDAAKSLPAFRTLLEFCKKCADRHLQFLIEENDPMRMSFYRGAYKAYRSIAEIADGKEDHIQSLADEIEKLENTINMNDKAFGTPPWRQTT